MYPCPCCGYLVFAEPPGSYAICPICYWEDDIVQFAFPDLAGGANRCSLIDGQRNYVRVGACEVEMRPHVRAPTEEDRRDAGWRPIDSASDPLLRWSNEEDRHRWQSLEDTLGLSLYYWRWDYWLKDKQGEPPAAPGSPRE